MKLTVGTRVYTATQPTHRFTGNFVVYAGKPWHPAAKAVISNLDYKILPAAGGNVGKTSIITYGGMVHACSAHLASMCTLWLVKLYFGEKTLCHRRQLVFKCAMCN